MCTTAHIHVAATGGHPSKVVEYSTLFWGEGVQLNLKLAVLAKVASWPVSSKDPLVSATQYLYYRYSDAVFSKALGIQTQVLLLTQQALLPTETKLSHLNLKQYIVRTK